MHPCPADITTAPSTASTARPSSWTMTRCSRLRRKTGRSSSSAAPAPIPVSSTSRKCARSRMPSAPTFWRISPTSAAWWPRGCTHRRCPTPMMNRAMEHFELLQVNSKPTFFVTHTDMPYKVTDYTLASYIKQMRLRVLDRMESCQSAGNWRNWNHPTACGSLTRRVRWTGLASAARCAISARAADCSPLPRRSAQKTRSTRWIRTPIF